MKAGKPAVIDQITTLVTPVILWDMIQIDQILPLYKNETNSFR